jgi:hypothetical protein
VRRRGAHRGFARRARVEVRQPNGFAHAQVARHDAWSAEGARQHPVGGPAADAADPTEPRDGGLVVQRIQVLQLQAAVDDGARRGHDRERLARGELQRADVERVHARHALGIERVDHLALDLVAPAEGFGQASPRRRRPAQIDLLRADASDQRGEHVQLADLANAWRPRVQSRQDRVVLKQALIVGGRWEEGPRDDLPHARFVGGFSGQHLEAPALRTRHERDPPPTSRVGGAHQALAIPAVDQVVARAAEQRQRARDVDHVLWEIDVKTHRQR